MSISLRAELAGERYPGLLLGLEIHSPYKGRIFLEGNIWGSVYHPCFRSRLHNAPARHGIPLWPDQAKPSSCWGAPTWAPAKNKFFKGIQVVQRSKRLARNSWSILDPGQNKIIPQEPLEPLKSAGKTSKAAVKPNHRILIESGWNFTLSDHSLPQTSIGTYN